MKDKLKEEPVPVVKLEGVKTEVNSSPKVGQKRKRSEMSAEECPICLENFKKGERRQKMKNC